uniref:Uncharacterized protein n=1 Tax=Kalanchoe fedtschenkoi TaxID=63787 RepID=A0A7N0V6F5_KALFE
MVWRRPLKRCRHHDLRSSFKDKKPNVQDGEAVQEATETPSKCTKRVQEAPEELSKHAPIEWYRAEDDIKQEKLRLELLSTTKFRQGITRSPAMLENMRMVIPSNSSISVVPDSQVESLEFMIENSKDKEAQDPAKEDIEEHAVDLLAGNLNVIVDWCEKKDGSKRLDGSVYDFNHFYNSCWFSGFKIQRSGLYVVQQNRREFGSSRHGVKLKRSPTPDRNKPSRGLGLAPSPAPFAAADAQAVSISPPSPRRLTGSAPSD